MKFVQGNSVETTGVITCPHCQNKQVPRVSGLLGAKIVTCRIVACGKVIGTANSR